MLSAFHNKLYVSVIMNLKRPPEHTNRANPHAMQKHTHSICVWTYPNHLFEEVYRVLWHLQGLWGYSNIKRLRVKKREVEDTDGVPPSKGEGEKYEKGEAN